jgi:lysozyme
MRKRVLAAGVAVVLGAAGVGVLRARLRHRPALHLECQPGLTTPGIDVSYYQQTIDWPRVQSAGIRFAFIRLSDGATQRDAMFATNWEQARRAGIVRGAYQYFRPDQSVAAQADLMIAAMRGRVGDDLPPAIDIEIDAGLGPAVVAERAAEWVARVRAGLGVEPIVYTGSDLWRVRGADPLGSQPLWIAHYTQGCPTLPSTWDRWTFWQHTDHGAVPGIEGAVDLDRFAGTIGGLRAEPR